MSALFAIIFYAVLYLVAAVGAVVLGYAAFLLGAYTFFQWQDRRAVLRHARLRAEGF